MTATLNPNLKNHPAKYIFDETLKNINNNREYGGFDVTGLLDNIWEKPIPTLYVSSFFKQNEDTYKRTFCNKNKIREYINKCFAELSTDKSRYYRRDQYHIPKNYLKNSFKLHVGKTRKNAFSDKPLYKNISVKVIGFIPDTQNENSKTKDLKELVEEYMYDLTYYMSSGSHYNRLLEAYKKSKEQDLPYFIPPYISDDKIQKKELTKERQIEFRKDVFFCNPLFKTYESDIKPLEVTGARPQEYTSSELEEDITKANRIDAKIQDSHTVKYEELYSYKSYSNEYTNTNIFRTECMEIMDHLLREGKEVPLYYLNYLEPFYLSEISKKLKSKKGFDKLKDRIETFLINLTKYLTENCIKSLKQNQSFYYYIEGFKFLNDTIKFTNSIWNKSNYYILNKCKELIELDLGIYFPSIFVSSLQTAGGIIDSYVNIKTPYDICANIIKNISLDISTLKAIYDDDKFPVLQNYCEKLQNFPIKFLIDNSEKINQKVLTFNKRVTRSSKTKCTYLNLLSSDS